MSLSMTVDFIQGSIWFVKVTEWHRSRAWEFGALQATFIFLHAPTSAPGTWPFSDNAVSSGMSSGEATDSSCIEPRPPKVKPMLFTRLGLSPGALIYNWSVTDKDEALPGL